MGCFGGKARREGVKKFLETQIKGDGQIDAMSSKRRSSKGRGRSVYSSLPDLVGEKSWWIRGKNFQGGQKHLGGRAEAAPR